MEDTSSSCVSNSIENYISPPVSKDVFQLTTINVSPEKGDKIAKILTKNLVNRKDLDSYYIVSCMTDIHRETGDIWSILSLEANPCTRRSYMSGHHPRFIMHSPNYYVIGHLVGDAIDDFSSSPERMIRTIAITKALAPNVL